MFAEKEQGALPDTAGLECDDESGEAYAERYLCLIEHHQGIADDEVEIAG